MINHFSQLSKDSYTSLEVEMEQSAMVTNPQFSPVSVYDYYDPGIEILLVHWARKVAECMFFLFSAGKTVTRYYKPETSEPLTSLYDEKQTSGPTLPAFFFNFERP